MTLEVAHRNQGEGAEVAATGKDRWQGALSTMPYVAFLLSGASGLIFQTIWGRLLHHVFGSSSVAISSVVSAFMGGLALGAYLSGRVADRLKRPLYGYALAEAIIGLWALLLPDLLRPDGALAAVNGWLRATLPLNSHGFMLARFLCIVPALLLPTTLMGATLPLLVRHFVKHNQGHASLQAGRLYAVNTLGGVLGVLAAGFWWMPSLGVGMTNRIAAGMNLSLALGVWLYARRSGRGSTAHAGGREAGAVGASKLGSGPGPGALSAWTRRAAAISFACSGVAALAYEVVFSRALVNTIGGSVYAFALILATFLVGIACGSGYATWILGAARPAVTRSLSALALVLSTLAALPLLLRSSLETFLAAIVAASCALALLTLGLLRERKAHAWLNADQGGPQAAVGERPWLRDGLPLMAVPAGVALIAVAVDSDTLSVMLLSTTITLVAFALLVLGLREQRLLLIVALQAFIGLSTLASSLWTDRLSIAFASLVTPLYDDLPNHVATVMALMSFMTSLCILPAALAMGAMFPATMAVFSRGSSTIGRDVSQVYTGNTLGSIAGAWLPGFLLLPMLGMQKTLHLGIACNLGLALFAFLLGREAPDATPSRAYGRASFSALGLGLLCFYVTSASPLAPELRWNISRMTLGAFRISLAKNVLDEESWGAPELLFHRDGLSTTVTVERWGRHTSLKNNGKVEASSGDDMPTQIMVSAYPLLMHRDGPRDLSVAIIGFGSGVTVGAALQFPVRTVTTIELEQAVVEASRYFKHVNHLRYPYPSFPFAKNPRLQVVNDDGRNHLAATRERYDVIISEPSNPWLTGVSDLFTVEHFRISKRRLKDKGVYCQWVQLYEMSPENVKIIYRTFASHFRHVLVFSAEQRSSDTILVGSDTPFEFDFGRLRPAFADSSIAAELERAGVSRPQDMVARLLFASRDEVMRYTQAATTATATRGRSSAVEDSSAASCELESCRPVPLNTDDNALIEFGAPKDLISFERYRGYLHSLYASNWPYGHVHDALGLPARGTDAQRELAHLALAQLAHGRMTRAHAALAAARAAATEISPELRMAERVVSLLSSSAEASPTVALPQFAPPNTAQLSPRLRRILEEGVRRAAELGARGQHGQAFAALQEIPAPLRRHAGSGTRFMHAYYALMSGREGVAVDSLEPLMQLEPSFSRAHPEALYVLARAHYARQHFARGVMLMRSYAWQML